MNQTHSTALFSVSTLAALVAVIYLATTGAFERTPDFAELEAGKARKQAFFDYFRPLIRSENDEIRSDRLRLHELAADAEQLDWIDQYTLASLADKYDLDTDDLSDAEIIAELKLRIDVVPPSLVLAQAAKESGWGTARFAFEGNNYFGQRCWAAGCGIIPAARVPGAAHEVASFSSAARSLESYLRNLNTHDEYEDFRATRARLRAADERLSGIVLAEHLGMYSERRQSYINELKSFIRFNNLEENL